MMSFLENQKSRAKKPSQETELSIIDVIFRVNNVKVFGIVNNKQDFFQVGNSKICDYQKITELITLKNFRVINSEK